MIIHEFHPFEIKSSIDFIRKWEGILTFARERLYIVSLMRSINFWQSTRSNHKRRVGQYNPNIGSDQYVFISHTLTRLGNMKTIYSTRMIEIPAGGIV